MRNFIAGLAMKKEWRRIQRKLASRQCSKGEDKGRKGPSRRRLRSSKRAGGRAGAVNSSLGIDSW